MLVQQSLDLCFYFEFVHLLVISVFVHYGVQIWIWVGFASYVNLRYLPKDSDLCLFFKLSL